MTADELAVVGRVVPQRPDEPAVEVRRTLAGPFAAAQDAAGMEKAARTAFDKLGDTRLELASFTWRNADGRFVPVSRLNHLRRDLAAGLEQASASGVGRTRPRSLLADVCPPSSGREANAGVPLVDQGGPHRLRRRFRAGRLGRRRGANR